MKKHLRLVVFTMCIAALLSLFGCGKRFMVDGPGMERELWSEFTISRSSVTYEPVYSYKVIYDDVADEAWIFAKFSDSKAVDINKILTKETVSELFNLNLMALPEAEPLEGTVLGLSVTDSKGNISSKKISAALEEEILALLTPYLEDPFMLDGPSMEHQGSWESFSLSYRGTEAQDGFFFEVTDLEQAVVVGECNDEEGNSFVAEEGIPLAEEDLEALRNMMLEDLPEQYKFPEDMEPIMDDHSLDLTLIFSDGTTVEKSISSETAFEIYKILLPYFKNN